MVNTADKIEGTIRRAQPADLDAAAEVLFQASKAAAERFGFEPDFPSVEIARAMGAIFLNHPKSYGVAAEIEGKLIGVGFLSERNEVRGIGPVVVDPAMQARGVGRLVLKALMDRAAEARGARMVADTANPAAVAVCEASGLNTREPLFLMFGIPRGEEPPGGYDVRAMRKDDLKACNDLCERVHGYNRNAELDDAMAHFGSVVAIRRGRIVAYSSAPTLWLMNHGVAESEKDMKALILHAGLLKDAPLSLLVPGRNNDLFRACLAMGLRIAKSMTFLSSGFYQDPRAPWFPSIEY